MPVSRGVTIKGPCALVHGSGLFFYNSVSAFVFVALALTKLRALTRLMWAISVVAGTPAPLVGKRSYARSPCGRLLLKTLI